jgi:hypothetical protein
MPADLDQFGREYSDGAVVGGKGLVELGHMAANGRSLVNQVNFKSRSGKVERGLDPADPSADDQDVSKVTLCQTLTKLLNFFFFHFCPHSFVLITQISKNDYRDFSFLIAVSVP